MDKWLTTLKTATPQEGFELAITISATVNSGYAEYSTLISLTILASTFAHFLMRCVSPNSIDISTKNYAIRVFGENLHPHLAQL